MESGTTHSSGTDATFCVMWLLTASSMTDPVAASAHHRSWRASVGRASSTATDCVCADATPTPLRLDHAATAASATNSAYPTDHASACTRVATHGSSRKG